MNEVHLFFQSLQVDHPGISNFLKCVVWAIKCTKSALNARIKPSYFWKWKIIPTKYIRRGYAYLQVKLNKNTILIRLFTLTCIRWCYLCILKTLQSYACSQRAFENNQEIPRWFVCRLWSEKLSLFRPQIVIKSHSD